MWLGGQLLVSCEAGGCSCLCIGGGPAGWVEPHCTGVGALSPAGLLSQALRKQEGALVTGTSLGFFYSLL